MKTKKQKPSCDQFTEPIIVPVPEYDAAPYDDPEVVTVVPDSLEQLNGDDVGLPTVAGFTGTDAVLGELWNREARRILAALPAGSPDGRDFLALARLAFSDYDVTLWFGDRSRAIWAGVYECDLTVRLSSAKGLCLGWAQLPCSARRRCSVRRHKILPVTRWPKSPRF
jgi:hypothetical protein